MSSKKKNILFVSGTDTGIGKTTVSCLLLQALREEGFRLAVMKPVETGCKVTEDGNLFAADADALLRASGSQQSADSVCPFRYQSALAPMVCAKSEKKPIHIETLLAQVDELAGDVDLLLIEGAGGLMVPLTEHAFMADLAQASGAAVLMVVGSKLGAINHALLSFEALRNRELPVVGYVLNEFTEATEEHGRPAVGLSARSTNREIIARFAENLGLVEVQFVEYRSADVSGLTKAVKNYFQLGML